MQRNDFKTELQKVNGYQLENLVIWNNYHVYDMKMDETHDYQSFEEMMDFMCGDKTLGELIDEMEKMEIKLNGGGGKGYGKNLFSDSPKGKDRTRYDYPARMNRLYDGNKQSFENTLKNFQDAHIKSKIEHAVMVDDNGYVSIYKHGNSGSVSWYASELTGMVIHNHPSDGWGNFSKADMVTTATTKATGIVATGGKGTFILKKTAKADNEGFVKAINKARSTDSNYDRAVDRWLKKNAKKYGYVYSTIDYTPSN